MPISTFLFTLLAYSGPNLDLKVDGAGLLRFARNGRAVYAKSASLTVDSGHLVSAGCDLLPAVTVPNDAISIDADLEGNLYAIKLNGKSKIGKLVLAMFANEGALTPDDKFLIAQDRPKLGEAGQDLFGVIRKAGDNSAVVVTAPPAALPQIAPIKAPVTTPTAVRPTTTAQVATYRANQTIKGQVPVITIRPDSQAKGDKILLGEVADVVAQDSAKSLLESAVIGDTPSIGVSRGLDAITITSGLTRAGWKPGTYVLNMTPGAKVCRQCQLVTDDRFVAAATDAVRDQLRILAPMHSDVPQPPLSCPLGEVSMRVEGCSRAGLGATATVGIYVDGQRINARTIRLSPDRNAVGVTQGQRVKIIARAAGAVVEMIGKAKDQGWAGQQISVETDTGAVLTGVINQDGAVEVNL